MARLRAATERLAQAVARLESASTARLQAGDSDRAELANALAAAQAERDRLDRQRDEVADRLDRAIDRLSRAVGEEPAGGDGDPALGEES